MTPRTNWLMYGPPILVVSITPLSLAASGALWLLGMTDAATTALLLALSPIAIALGLAAYALWLFAFALLIRMVNAIAEHHPAGNHQAH